MTQLPRTLTLSQALQLASEHLHQGNLQQAEHVCRRILQVVPNQSEALHLLGIIAYRTQHHEHAIRLIQQAIIYQPTLLDAYYNLATIFKELGKYQESIEYYEKGLALEFNLGYPFDLEKLVIFLCQSTLSGWHERQEHLVNYGHCLYQAGNLQKRANLLHHIAHHLKRNYLHSSIF